MKCNFEKDDKIIKENKFHIIRFLESIYDMCSYKYYIVKFVKNKNNTDIKILYRYKDENNWGYHREQVQSYYLLNYLEILYSNDKLYKCINELKTIEDVEKYNL